MGRLRGEQSESSGLGVVGADGVHRRVGEWLSDLGARDPGILLILGVGNGDPHLDHALKSHDDRCIQGPEIHCRYPPQQRHGPKIPGVEVDR